MAPADALAPEAWAQVLDINLTGSPLLIALHGGPGGEPGSNVVLSSRTADV